MALILGDDVTASKRLLASLASPSYSDEVLTVSNKYYTAQVPLHFTDIADFEGSFPGHIQLVLVLVSGITVRPSNLLEKLSEDDQLDSKVIACYDSIPNWVENDLGLEVVGLSDTENNGTEKQGIERLVEIFDTTMWHNLVMNDNIENDFGKCPITKNEGNDLAKSPFMKNEGNEVAKKPSIQNEENDLGKSPSTKNEDIENGLEKSPATPDDILNHLDGDDSDFMNLLQEMQSMKLEFGSITSEERRDRASDLAMKLLNLIDE